MLLVLASCESELPLPSPEGGNKIVLIGELTANDSVLLRAGQSKPLTTKSEILKNLTISIAENGGPVAPLQERNDVSSYLLYTLPFSSNQTIHSGSTYKLVAKHPDLGEVNAEVQIPEPFSVTLAGKHFVNFANDSVLKVDLDIANPDSKRKFVVEVLKRFASIDGIFYYNAVSYNYRGNRKLYDSLKTAGVPVSENLDTSYSEEFYRQQFYINDPQSDNGSTGSRFFSRLYLSGETLLAGLHRTQMLIPKRNIVDEFGQNVQTIIYVKSVAPEYFNYLKAYDAYYASPDPGSSSVSEKLTGNVNGGFGMIGGVYAVRFEMIF